MLSFELAKKLKDAGFIEPIQAFSKAEIYVRNKENDRWYPGDKEPLLELPDHGEEKPYDWGLFSPNKHWDYENYVYCPTLGELIEACGERFESLKIAMMPGEWWAWEKMKDKDGKPITGKGGIGYSPSEAVANLWLAFNEKK